MSTSGGQSSKASEQHTLDSQTFYLRPSAAGNLTLVTDVRKSKDKDTSRTHGFTAWTKVDKRDFPAFLSVHPGPAQAIDAVSAKLEEFTEKMTARKKEDAARRGGEAELRIARLRFPAPVPNEDIEGDIA